MMNVPNNSSRQETCRSRVLAIGQSISGAQQGSKEDTAKIKHFELHKHILLELDRELPPCAKVLDFGWGAGKWFQSIGRPAMKPLAGTLVVSPLAVLTIGLYRLA